MVLVCPSCQMIQALEDDDVESLKWYTEDFTVIPCVELPKEKREIWGFEDEIPLVIVVCLFDASNCLQYLMDKKSVDINYTDSYNRSLLFFAILSESVNVMLILLKAVTVDGYCDSKGNGLFHVAVMTGNFTVLRILLEHCKNDIDLRNSMGDTPFLYATIKADARFLKHFMNNDGIDLHWRNNDLDNAVSLAVKAHRTCLLPVLIGAGINVNNTDAQGWTPLFLACEHHFDDIVQVLIECPETDVNKVSASNTPLHIACAGGYAHITELLLSRTDLDVNARALSGITPFHLAICCQRVEIVALLLADSRLDPNLTDDNGRTCFRMALLEPNYRIINLLLSCSRVHLNLDMETTSLLARRIAEVGQIEPLRGLILRGVDPDEPDQYGMNLLTIAVALGSVEMTRMILSTRKININRTFNRNHTILHFAVMMERSAICMKLLLLYPGINVNAQEDHGNTALHLAACMRTQIAVDYLLHDRRVDKNIRNFEGLSPLHAAILDGTPEILGMFIQYRDVDVTLVTPKGNDPWTLAMLLKRYDMLEILMERPEVNVNARIPGKGTALAAAVEDEEESLVRKLLEARNVRLRGIGPNGEDLVNLALLSSNLGITSMVLQKYQTLV